MQAILASSNIDANALGERSAAEEKFFPNESNADAQARITQRFLDDAVNRTQAALDQLNNVAATLAERDVFVGYSKIGLGIIPADISKATNEVVLGMRKWTELTGSLPETNMIPTHAVARINNESLTEFTYHDDFEYLFKSDGKQLEWNDKDLSPERIDRFLTKFVSTAEADSGGALQTAMASNNLESANSILRKWIIDQSGRTDLSFMDKIDLNSSIARVDNTDLTSLTTQELGVKVGKYQWIKVGRTTLTSNEVDFYLNYMQKRPNYSLLANNCQNHANEIKNLLTKGIMPVWMRKDENLILEAGTHLTGSEIDRFVEMHSFKSYDTWRRFKNLDFSVS
jgi:hypothetical protein